MVDRKTRSPQLDILHPSPHYKLRGRNPSLKQSIQSRSWRLALHQRKERRKPSRSPRLSSSTLPPSLEAASWRRTISFRRGQMHSQSSKSLTFPSSKSLSTARPRRPQRCVQRCQKESARSTKSTGAAWKTKDFCWRTRLTRFQVKSSRTSSEGSSIYPLPVIVSSNRSLQPLLS